ncbi:asparagine synthetase B family protein [Boudabousia marimammalium]|uniref:asparagine synthase (glutamine-hydrolyzing) n=1 Tax=Boudabousia marimammalium TaxID=156892 RepID=A0A1Q5PRJ0_9ACTO|nr:asparagine synthetase B family protein [Boudabousia marimammalium]OKL50228.1 hypothetical protein BM477_02205 [Boudabousia marimammalium]
MKLIQHWQRLRPVSSDSSLYYFHGLGIDLPHDFDVTDDSSVLHLRSHYALAEVKPKEVQLVTDQIRSFPLYYAVTEDTVAVSDAPYWIANQLSLPIAEDRYQLVAETGFTWPDQTFYRGLNQVLPGTRLTISLDSGAVKETTLHQPLFSDTRDDIDETEFVSQLNSALDTTMERAIAACGDSKILVPLSGGLDSRLIVTWLARHAVPNVLCFTYGRRESKEISISEQIAKNLGLDWTAVYLDDEAVKAAWLDPDTADFLKYCAAGASLPHVQDWYALRRLKEQGLASEGDVVFPGHTIVDNFHNHEMLEHLPVEIREVITVVESKHFVMKPSVETGAGRANFRLHVGRFLQDQNYDGSGNSLQRCIEGLNVLTRQTMYINNSMRAYEFFGLRWAIPMLDREFTDIWCSAPLDLTITRRVYGDWIQNSYQSQTGIKPVLYAGVTTYIPQSIMRTLRKVSSLVGLTTVVNRYYSTKACLHHPMGFDLFYGTTTKWEQISRFSAGASSTAIWTDQFLKDTWQPDLNLFHTQRE